MSNQNDMEMGNIQLQPKSSRKIDIQKDIERFKKSFIEVAADDISLCESEYGTIYEENDSVAENLNKAFISRDFARLQETLNKEEVDPNYYFNYLYFWGRRSSFVISEELNENRGIDCRTLLHFASEAGDVEIMKILLAHPKIDINLQVNFYTALHMVIQFMGVRKNDDEYLEKYEKILELLLEKGANANIPDENNNTPIQTAVKLGLDNIVCMILEKGKHLNLDYFKDSCNKTTRMTIEEKLPHLTQKLPSTNDLRMIDDRVRLMQYLINDNEDDFLDEFYEMYPDKLKDLLNVHNGEYTLLQLACHHGLKNIVFLLLKKGSNPNLEAPARKGAPLNLASEKGFHEIVEVLLYHQPTFDGLTVMSTIFMNYKQKTDLMHCEVDFDKCLNKLIPHIYATQPCPRKIFNEALIEASKYNHQELLLQLLKKGTYIGMLKNKAMPLENMSPATLKTHLDSCVTKVSYKYRKNEFVLSFNYANLNPTYSKLETQNDFSREMDLLLYMSKNQKYKELLLHPVFQSFLYLKWKRVGFLFWINILLYFLFYMSFVVYILLDYKHTTKGYSGQAFYNAQILLAVSLVFLTLREAFQFFISPREYIRSFENWMEITFILIVNLIFSDMFGDHVKQQYCVAAILICSAELFLLLGKVPILSTYIEMLRKVSWNFFKIIVWYSISIFAFALSFHILFREGVPEEEDNKTVTNVTLICPQNEEANFFLNPFVSIFKTLVMLTGEFEAESIPFEAFPVTSNIVFVLFLFMIPIVLFNLLNALAVGDIQAIMSKAELVGIISRIKLVSYFEDFFLAKIWGKYFLSWRARRVCLFPYTLFSSQMRVFEKDSKYVIICRPGQELRRFDFVKSLNRWRLLKYFFEKINTILMDKKIMTITEQMVKKSSENDCQSTNEQLRRTIVSIDKVQEELKTILVVNKKEYEEKLQITESKLKEMLDNHKKEFQEMLDDTKNEIKLILENYLNHIN